MSQPALNILIEGPDCVGKSTLAKELKNHLSYDLLASHHRPGCQFRRYLQLYAQATATIFERGHWSEMVYSQLCKRQQPFNEQEQKILDDILQETALIIFVKAPLPLMQTRYIARQGEYQSTAIDQLQDSQRLFEKVALQTTVHFHYSSVHWDNLATLVKAVKTKLAFNA
jgi:thymidylate kinase